MAEPEKKITLPKPSQPSTTPEEIVNKETRKFEETSKRIEELRELIEKERKGK